MDRRQDDDDDDDDGGEERTEQVEGMDGKTDQQMLMEDKSGHTHTHTHTHTQWS